MLSILPSIIDIQVVQKTDHTIEFVLETNSVAVDLSADTVTFVAKTNYGGTAKVSKSNGPSGHSDPTHGKTTFALLKTELVGSAPTKPEVWVYEVRRVLGGTGDEIVYFAGSLTLNPTL